MKLFRLLLLLLLWCDSLCTARLCWALLSSTRFSIWLCSALFYSLPFCSVLFLPSYSQQLDFSLQIPTGLTLQHHSLAYCNCCGLSPHQPASVLKKDYVCCWLFRFYLYFKPHTRSRVGLELVTGAWGCIIHENEPLAAAAK